MLKTRKTTNLLQLQNLIWHDNPQKAGFVTMWHCQTLGSHHVNRFFFFFITKATFTIRKTTKLLRPQTLIWHDNPQIAGIATLCIARDFIVSIKFYNKINVHCKEKKQQNRISFKIWFDMITPKTLALPHCHLVAMPDTWGIIMSIEFCNKSNVHHYNNYLTATAENLDLTW